MRLEELRSAVEAGTIDVAISPQQVTIGSLLAHVRRGDVVKVHSLRRGAAEAIEAVAQERVRDVIARVVDGSRFEEFKPRYGSTIVCGWAGAVSAANGTWV